MKEIETNNLSKMIQPANGDGFKSSLTGLKLPVPTNRVREAADGFKGGAAKVDVENSA